MVHALNFTSVALGLFLLLGREARDLAYAVAWGVTAAFFARALALEEWRRVEVPLSLPPSLPPSLLSPSPSPPLSRSQVRRIEVHIKRSMIAPSRRQPFSVLLALPPNFARARASKSFSAANSDRPPDVMVERARRRRATGRCRRVNILF